VDILGVVPKTTVCLPGLDPGVSVAMALLEMAVSPSSIVNKMSKVALKAGSSKQGKARRASVD